jgi:hypothetical protein
VAEIIGRNVPESAPETIITTKSTGETAVPTWDGSERLGGAVIGPAWFGRTTRSDYLDRGVFPGSGSLLAISRASI